MKLTAWIAAAGLALMLTACEAGGPAPHAGPAAAMRTRTQGDQGKVVGSFSRVGGPLGSGGQQPPTVPLSGTLSFNAAHRRTVAVRVGKSGQFSVWLPAGAYRVVRPLTLDPRSTGVGRDARDAMQPAGTRHGRSGADGAHLRRLLCPVIGEDACQAAPMR